MRQAKRRQRVHREPKVKSGRGRIVNREDGEKEGELVENRELAHTRGSLWTTNSPDPWETRLGDLLAEMDERGNMVEGPWATPDQKQDSLLMKVESVLGLQGALSEYAITSHTLSLLSTARMKLIPWELKEFHDHPKSSLSALLLRKCFAAFNYYNYFCLALRHLVAPRFRHASEQHARCVHQGDGPQG